MMQRCPFAEWRPSPHHSNRGDAKIDLIIVHHTDGGPRAERTVEGFQKPENEKSAHFVVGQGGEIYQLVEISRSAWHDVGRNKRSVGIEHSARTPGELKVWASLSEHTRRALLPEGIACDLEKDPGFPLTDAQLRASAKLVAWLLTELNLTVDAVVPHCSNPESSHRDCGRDVANGGIWPWPEYRRLIDEALSTVSDGIAGNAAR